ncbi:tRNA uridine-5-carboxymethylaminomethyl(34) synthesis enzyme MnmG [Candidatus Mycoplasma haematohominis]|uniref:tRNA uridine-5-carboxymethylaminomethyl(34) synthesis enzyme MnmG n=1 Tax=Candidatus Mycoplasma haematohominis TaxID=1494318 RepID=UPI001C0A6F9E|nr:tRNA uridine-5-carboxymethylaminomethyl(34) synthesis enzyme MnmG [Candidatus Mycoplasma haemohominis]
MKNQIPKKQNNSFDVIVIGAGHAGLEAAFVASKLGLKVGLFNLNTRNIANLPCNPSIGGPAKGVVTREIDALGGIQAIAADANKIQIKKLNYSKGPGVWAYRAQIDKETYHSWFLEQIEKEQNLHLVLEEVISLERELIDEQWRITGVQTNNAFYICKAVIVTTGTYLKAELYREKKFADSGPEDNPASNKLSDIFKSWDIDLLRLKTGTPPRVYKDSIDFSSLERDDNNNDSISFSFREPKSLPLDEQLFCYLTNTTEETKKIILDNLDELGTYNGAICGTGPRYCPSIEDKYIKFPSREIHHIFVEPVARNYDFYYLAGLSTSLNKDLQEKLVRSLKGFEKARIKSYAYSIVYDAINPIQLHKTLELKKISGLYFAGQINGTSGYEEAAAQGLIAGINASLKILGKPPLVLRRDEAYIGVMIDDLTSKGVREPYRLLTSRAEYRLLLRNDNADERLMSKGFEIGTIDKETYLRFKATQEDIEHNISFLKNNYASKYRLTTGEEGPLTIFSWLSRTTSKYEMVIEAAGDKLRPLSLESMEKLMIKVKYEGYIKNQESRINKVEKWKKISLLGISDYREISNLSREAIEKLNLEKPITIDDAMRIEGINLNDIFWIKAFLDADIKGRSYS